MITVRTLKTVGGIRSGAKGTRKLNRFARVHGFPTFVAMKADFDLRMKGYLVE